MNSIVFIYGLFTSIIGIFAFNHYPGLFLHFKILYFHIFFFYYITKEYEITQFIKHFLKERFK